MVMVLFTLSINVSLAQSINYSDIYQKTIKDPAQTFSEVEQLLLSPNLANDDKNKLKVIQSEIAYFLDQPEHILSYVSEALSSGVLNNKWHARALISKARGHLQRKENKLFLIASQAAVNKAKKSVSPYQETAAIVEQAFAYVITGKIAIAKEKIKLAKKYISLLADDFNKAMILHRYSATLSKLGQYSLAIDVSIKAVQILEKLNAPHFISVGYYNLALSYDRANQIKLAAKQMELSYRWAVKDNNKLNQAFSLASLAKYQEQLNYIDQAKQTLLKAVNIANKTNSNRVKILSLKHLALFSCKYTQGEKCQQYLQESISIAEQFNFKKDRSELLKILADELFKDKKYKAAYEALKNSENLINSPD